MANRITGSTPALPVTALRNTGAAHGPTKVSSAQAGSTPLVSSKTRLAAEQVDKGTDGLYNFLELGQAGAAALVDTLSSATGTEPAEVRQSFNKMRFYVTSCMFGSRAVKNDDFPLLLKFSSAWTQTPIEDRKVFQFGAEFDRFVAQIKPPLESAGPSFVSRETAPRK